MPSIRRRAVVVGAGIDIDIDIDIDMRHCPTT